MDFDSKLFVHTADLHLAPRSSSITKRDRRTNRLLRDLDMSDAFERAVDEAIAASPRPSSFVIAGDIFDTYQGSSDAFIDAVTQIRRLRNAGISVVGIAGNHDTPTNMLKTSMYEMLANVFEADSAISLTSGEKALAELEEALAAEASSFASRGKDGAAVLSSDLLKSLEAIAGEHGCSFDVELGFDGGEELSGVTGPLTELYTFARDEWDGDDDELDDKASRIRSDYGFSDGDDAGGEDPKGGFFGEWDAEWEPGEIHLAYDRIEHVRIGDVEYVLLPHICCAKGNFVKEDLQRSTDAPYAVLVVHGVAAGDPSLQQMDEMKEVPIAKWIMDMDWDYVAFGHYHKPGWIPGYAGKAAYSGSLENTVISGPDVAMRRGPVFVDMRKSGDELYDMHELPIRNIVELDDIDVAKMDEGATAEDLEQAIEKLLVNAEIDGAIVRHTVKNVPQSMYKSLSRRAFQASVPKALFVKTNWEIARESPHITQTMIQSSEDGTETAEEGEVSEESQKDASNAFKPLAAELREAVEMLAADNVIQESRKQAVMDIVIGLL